MTIALTTDLLKNSMEPANGLFIQIELAIELPESIAYLCPNLHPRKHVNP